MISTKICSKCCEEKLLTDFYKRSGKRKGNPTAFCKKCTIIYIGNKEISKKLKAIQLLGNCCLDCKQSFSHQVYDFHHLDPNTKDYDWSDLRKFSWKTIELELSKCILLCANCHRIRHI